VVAGSWRDGEFRLALTDQFGQHRPTLTNFSCGVRAPPVDDGPLCLRRRPPGQLLVNTSTLPSDQTLNAACMAKRQQILDGAATLFLHNGYEGTSMSQVAREAGVSKGTLYNYFDCKAQLFSALIEAVAETKLRNVYERIHSDDLDCATTLQRVAEAMIRTLLQPDSMMLYRIIVAEARKFPLLADIFWQRAFGVSISTLADWIANRAARGELVVDDPVFAAEQFFMLCQTRIVQRHRFELPVDKSDAAIKTVARITSDSFMKLNGVH
jgi:TetR/AcrR family transcriptional regulator, mexJK operon transcriptional repressor